MNLAMNNNQLDRVLRLVKKTGDKVVVVDRESDAVVVLMDLDDYEFLLEESFTNDGFTPTGEDSPVSLDWEADDLPEEETEDVRNDVNEPVILSTPLKTLEEELPLDAFEKEATQFEEGDQVNFISEPTDGEQVAQTSKISLDKEEKIDDIPDDGEEERFYLEPV